MSSQSGEVYPDILPLLAQAVADLAKTASTLSEVAQSFSGSGKESTASSQEALKAVLLATKNIQCIGALSGHNDTLGGRGGKQDVRSGDAEGGMDKKRYDALSQICGPTSTKAVSQSSGNTAVHRNAQSDPSLTAFKDTLASFGHYYVVLDEEFDALPLIATYASNSPKTVCYTAAPESTGCLRDILAAIVKERKIMAPTSKQQMNRLRQTIGALNASSTTWAMFLAFKILARMELGNCLSDCMVFWGLPPAQHIPDFNKAAERARHICVILSQDEYARPEVQQILTSLSIAKHPNSALFNNFEPDSLLSDARTILRRVLHEPEHQGHVHKLYETFLLYHGIGRTRPNKWKPLELARHANTFAAKVLLHGRGEDGSQRFQPDGKRLQVSAEMIRRVGLQEAVRAGLILEVGSVDVIAKTPLVVPVPANVSKDSGNSSASVIEPSTARPSNPHSYITLEEDFDVIPLICYFADNHPKTMCFISHQKTISFYTPILERITSRQVICPGKKMSSVVKGIQKLADSESGILLLPGEIGARTAMRGVMTDAVVHWGLPEKGHFLGQIKFLKTNSTYLILPTDEKAAVASDAVRDNKVQEHPESVRLTAYGPKSPLLRYRKKTTAVLSSIKPESLKQAYLDLLVKRARSKLEVARRANRFMAHVLLHGEPEDGSQVYKPIAPRIKVSSAEAHGRGLGPAISQGLLHLST